MMDNYNVVIAKVTQNVTINCFDVALLKQHPQLIIDLYHKTLTKGTKMSFIAKYNPKKQKLMGENLTRSQRERFRFSNNGKLHINQITLSDEGAYDCYGHANPLSTPKVLSKTNVSVYVPPRSGVQILSEQPKADDDMINVAECRAIGGKPPAQVSWIFPQNLSSKQKVTTEINSQTPNLTDVISTLQIASPRRNLQGNFEFKCQIFHKSFSDSADYKIILSIPTDPRITFNKSANQLTCSAEGNPSVKYTWILPKNEKAEGPTVNLLKIDDPDHETDQYFCLVETPLGARVGAFNMGYEESARLANIGRKQTVQRIIIAIISISVGVLVCVGCIKKKKSIPPTKLENDEDKKMRPTPSTEVVKPQYQKREETVRQREEKKRLNSSEHSEMSKGLNEKKTSMQSQNKDVKNSVEKRYEKVKEIRKISNSNHSEKESTHTSRKESKYESQSIYNESFYGFVRHPTENLIGISGWTVAEEDSNEDDKSFHTDELV